MVEKAMVETAGEADLIEVETEVIDLFVRAAQLIGLPKSIGEIYGLLFISVRPLSMDGIMERLNISLGTASQGLKQLKAFRAVKAVYMPGKRKDYFSAETEFRKLTAGFLKEEVYPQLESATERLESLKPLLAGLPGDRIAHIEGRLRKLESWHKMGTALIGKITTFINF